MNRRGLSAISYLLIGLFVVGVVLLIPLPHFNPDTGWYTGPSFIVRFLGSYEKGAPIDQVYSVVAEAMVTSPFEIRCNTNQDCTKYAVVSQCKVYCGNTNIENEQVVKDLGYNRVCDPSKWTPPSPECACVFGRCVNFSN